MKITFISTFLDYWGGSEVLWVKSVQMAVGQGHSVQVVVFSQKNGYHPAIDEIKKLVQSFVEIPNPINNFDYLAKAVLSVKNKIYPFRPTEILKYNADIIFVNQPESYSSAFNPFINALLNQITKPFYLLSHFNSDHHILAYNDIVKVKAIFGKAKHIYFVSKRNLEVAERQLAMKISNASVIDNHPDIRKFNLIDYPQEQRLINFASVARLEAQFKGQDILLQVLSGDKWVSRAWSLNFYGTGPDELYLKELTSFYGLDKRVRFHGHVSDINAVWNNNHALLMPSIGEGKPLALQEAMACGRIGVVSDVAGNGELVEDEINGFLASSYFPKPFDHALERAWAQKDSWADMGLIAHRKIIDTLDANPQQTLLNNITST